MATNPNPMAKQSSKHMSLQVSQMTLCIPGKFTHTRVRSEAFSCMNTLVNITNGDMNTPRDSNITGLSHQPFVCFACGKTNFQKKGQVEDGKMLKSFYCVVWLTFSQLITWLGFPMTVKWAKSSEEKTKKPNGINQIKIELHCFSISRRCVPAHTGTDWAGPTEPTYHLKSMHGSAPKHHKHTHTHTCKRVFAWQQRFKWTQRVQLWIYTLTTRKRLFQ